MQCPDCGFVMGDFDQECRRCKTLGKPAPKPAQSAPPPAPEPAPSHAASYEPAPAGRFCARCGSALVPGAPFCAGCGGGVDAAPAAPARIGLIITMWTVSVSAWVIGAGAGFAAGLLVDLVAVVMAFALIGGRAGGDRANGWLKLGLEAAVGVIAFLAAANAPPPPPAF